MKAHCQPEQNEVPLTKEEVENASFRIIWNSSMSAQAGKHLMVQSGLRGIMDLRTLNHSGAVESTLSLSPTNCRAYLLQFERL